MTILDEKATHPYNGTDIAVGGGEAASVPMDPVVMAGPARGQRSGGQEEPPGGGAEDAGRALLVIRILALVITGLVGVAAAVLSLASLADLAARAGYPAELSYL